MRKSLNKFLLLALILLLTGLSGCYDLRELEQKAFVLAFGLDKSQVDENYIRFTVMIAIPKELGGVAGGGGGGGGGKEGVMVTTIEAPTIPVAMNLINSYVGRELNFHQSTFIFFGDEYAKKEGLSKNNFIQRYHEIRRSARLFIVKGSVEEFIKEIKPKISANPNKYLTQIVDSHRFTGLLVDRSMHNFYIDVENPNVESVLPLCGLNNKAKEEKLGEGQPIPYENYLPGQVQRVNGTPCEFIGSAVFNKDKMIDELNGTETRMLNLIRGDYDTGYLLFPDVQEPKQFVTVKINAAQSPQTSINIKGKKAKIRVKLSLEGELISTRIKTDYGKIDNINKLEKIINKDLEDRGWRLIKKMQQNDTDVFDFGRKVAGKFLTWPEYMNYNWSENFKEAEITLEVHSQIRRVGYQIGPSRVY